MARKPQARGRIPLDAPARAAMPPWHVPSAWAWTTVAQVGAVRAGRARSPDTQSGANPTKYLRTANITGQGLDLTEVLEMDFTPAERAVYSLQFGDLVLAAASGSAAQVGRAATWADQIPDCCYQNHVIRFRPHAVTAEYAQLTFHYFSVAGLFAAVARGVGIQNLGTTDFARMAFPLPPLPEQVRICAEAGRRLQHSADARMSIETALKRNTQQDDTILEAAALGGLVDSGPEPRKEEQAPPGPESLFAEDVADVPDSEFADLLAHALPRNWRWIRVDQAGELRLGRQRSPEHEYGDDVVPYLRVANVFEDRIDTTDVRSMNFTAEEQEVYRLVPGDILLNEGQSPELVGRPAIYDGQPPTVFFQNTLIRFRASTSVTPRFALLVFRHYLRAGQFTRAARWSTNIAHLGVSRLAAIPFPLPPLEEQHRIVAEAGSRLAASGAQRASLAASVEKIEDMRREVLRATTSGALVAQSTDEESAQALLARLGAPPIPTKPTVRKEDRVARRFRNADAPKKPLYETVIAMMENVTPERLFKAAGYNSDSVADVESFYLALREELGVRIRQTGNDQEARLEVITDAP